MPEKRKPYIRVPFVVTVLPLRRMMKFHKIPARELTFMNGAHLRSCRSFELASLDKLCRRYKLHPQDIIWDQVFPMIPKKFDTAPLLVILDERGIKFKTILRKINYITNKSLVFRKRKLTPYDIYSLAFLLDVSPLDLVREIE